MEIPGQRQAAPAVSDGERAAMRRAIELSRRSIFETPPNPDVGCVVLDASGELVGQGWHRRFGGAHAEVEALDRAGAAARGGTAVVTLEPCAHTGRTGPCVDALLRAGISRVLYAVADPTPVAGGGAAALRRAGVDVVAGVLRDEAAATNVRWLLPHLTGRPFLTLKTATTLDGRVAARDGSSRWITGEQARADVHHVRSSVDAVLVGVGTVLVDDPALTVRGPDAPEAEDAALQPLRVVLDSRRRTPGTARVLDDTAPSWVVGADDVPTDADGRPEPAAVLAALYDRGVRSVLLEGGPTVNASFLRAGLVDRVIAYIAPALLGSGPSAVGDLGIDSIAQALRLEPENLIAVGGDVRAVATTQTARALVTGRD